MNVNLRYRLALDLGTNSLGWAVLALNDEGHPCNIVRLGSRIFSDARTPKEGASLAVHRREKRQQRRRLDRLKRRRRRYLAELISLGLMPAAVRDQQGMKSVNPWRLRSEGLDHELTPYELGRALFHLQQRRGFKSNRKTDSRKADDDTGAIKTAVSEFHDYLDGRTLGQVMWARIQEGKGESVRARLHGKGKSASYTHYVDRAMIADEFDRLWSYQQQFHPELLSESSRKTLREILLFQRDLHKPALGSCFYYSKEDRLAKSSATAQLFRLYQEVNHLRVLDHRNLKERPLTCDERDRGIKALESTGSKKLTTLRTAMFGKEDATHLTLSIERENRKTLLGDQVAAVFADKRGFGSEWWSLTLDERDDVARLVADEPLENVLMAKLMSDYRRTESQATWLAEQSLPSEHIRLGITAARAILKQLRDNWNDDSDAPLTYDQAVQAAGLGSHSQLDRGLVAEQLPYYGEILSRYTMPAPRAKGEERRWGIIGNPTVHRGLGQIRVVVNELIEMYGKPSEIVVEVARDLKNGTYTRSQIESIQKKGIDRNGLLDARLRDLGQACNYNNRLKLRLFDELCNTDNIATCVYTGRHFTETALFSRNEWEVEHILPLARTLDNSFANKTLAHHDANRMKSNQSPYEAFGTSPIGYDWDAIVTRANRLPRNKQIRFARDAMQKWESDVSFLDRQLTDTAYLSRVALQYLQVLLEPDQRSNIWSSPGRLTGVLRAKWGLNTLLSNDHKKNRNDHRHHAIDAVVIGLTDRATLQMVSKSARVADDKGLDRDFSEIKPPWEAFRRDMEEAVAKIVVSHKPNHSTTGGLHDDTALGIITGPGRNGTFLVRHRIPITDKKVSEKSLADLDVDQEFRIQIAEALRSASDRSSQKVALEKLTKRTGRSKVTYTENASIIPIFRKGESAENNDKPYKAYKGNGNYCYEIFVTESGKWDGEVITRYVANQPEFLTFLKSKRSRRFAFAGRPLVMRLCANDFVEIVEDGRRVLFRVQKFSDGRIVFVEPHEANVAARNADKDEDFSYFIKSPRKLELLGARQVFVTPAGRKRYREPLAK